MNDVRTHRSDTDHEGPAASLVWELEEYLRGMGLTLPLTPPTANRDERGETAPLIAHGHFYDLCVAALSLTKDEALGLHWGADIAGHMLGSIPPLVRHATTLRHALENVARLSSAMHMGPALGLLLDGKEAILQLRPVSADTIPERIWRMIAEFTLVGLYRIVDKYCPGPKNVKVTFDYPAPAYASEYALAFRGQAEFEHPHCGIVLDEALLATPSRHRDAQLFEAAQALVEQRCVKIAAESSFATNVFHILTRSHAPQAVSMEQVARDLGMSARSLQRRLAEEGTSYTAESHRASGAVAKQLLLRGRTIKEAASMMGFLDPSSFSRAFKRWTGAAPGQLTRR